ncbi:hypothetical protein GOV12_00370 [Candidatus Pacearchaeota archaeon]|nr:hypothetical protein [Candidatus Pacearchaeota archaeon]
MKKQQTTLKIDLTNKQTELEIVSTSKLSLEEKLGGIGRSFQAFEKYLKNNPNAGDTNDPSSLISIDTGSFTGSLSTSMRTYITFISPQKRSYSKANGIFYSTASGGLAQKIAGNGIDSLHLTGKSNEPVYIVLENGEVKFKNAEFLKDLKTHERILKLSKRYDNAAFAVIGPSANNDVLFASVAFSTNDQLKKDSNHMRFAGRGGSGYALAKKGIQAIVVIGDDYKQKSQIIKRINKITANKNGRSKKYRREGTFFGNIESMHALGYHVIDNFSRGRDNRTEKLFREALLQDGYEIDNKGCLGCVVKCWKEIKKDGVVLGKLDFEPGILLGQNLGIYELKQTMELIEICDQYGIDAMSSGVCLGYELDRLDKFGDFAFTKDLLLNIAKGNHDLKQGLLRYVENNDFSTKNAMHVKGIELAAYPGNGNPGYAFSIAGPHTSLDTYTRGVNFPEDNNISGWIANIWDRGLNILLYDMISIDKFEKATFEEVCELYQEIYEEDISVSDLRNAAKRVYMRGRRIDEMQGFTSNDDILPINCHQPLQGLVIPHFNTKSFFKQVKEGVYEKMREFELD